MTMGPVTHHFISCPNCLLRSLRLIAVLSEIFPKSRRHQSIVRATTDMAQSLGVMVVAEGVESEEAEALLRRYGVDISQGYYYSRPLPFNQYQAYVDRMGSVQPKTMIYSPQARSSSG